MSSIQLHCLFGLNWLHRSFGLKHLVALDAAVLLHTKAADEANWEEEHATANASRCLRSADVESDMVMFEESD